MGCGRPKNYFLWHTAETIYMTNIFLKPGKFVPSSLIMFIFRREFSHYHFKISKNISEVYIGL